VIRIVPPPCRLRFSSEYEVASRIGAVEATNGRWSGCPSFAAFSRAVAISFWTSAGELRAGAFVALEAAAVGDGAAEEGVTERGRAGLAAALSSIDTAAEDDMAGVAAGASAPVSPLGIEPSRPATREEIR
jgi:hypothetical protein